MEDLDSFMDDLESLMEEPVSDGSQRSALVAEYVPLNRRRTRGGPPLSVSELERWSELREFLEYQFGSANPPLGGSRRRHLRVPVQLKVRTSIAGVEVASLRDLSEGGAFIESAAPVDPETALRLEIDPGSGAAPLQLAAVVRWVRDIPNMDGPAGLGIEFSDVEDGDFAALSQLVESALLAAGREAP